MIATTTTTTAGSHGLLGHDGRVTALVGLAHSGSHFSHLVLPSLFPWLMPAFGIGAFEAGLLVTAFFAVSGVCQTPAGFLVDRVGAARVLAGGLAALGAGALVAALAPGYSALLAAAVLMGLGNSVFHPADYAILTHHVAAVRIGRAYSIHTVGGSLGWALAPLAMVTVATHGGWRAALLAASVVGLAIAALVWAGRRGIETPGREQRPATAVAGSPAGAAALLSGPIVMCFAFFALLSVAFAAMTNFMPLALNRLHGLPLVAAATTVTAYMLSMAVATLAGGVAADRSVHHGRIIALGLPVSAALLLLVGAVALPTPVTLAAVALAGAIMGFTTPSRDMLVRAATPEGSAGKVFGFVYSGLDLGATLAPVLAGWLVDHGRPIGVFVMAAAATLLSAGAAVAVRPSGPALPAVGR